jgi:hypothetical protein
LGEASAAEESDRENDRNCLPVFRFPHDKPPFPISSSATLFSG